MSHVRHLVHLLNQGFNGEGEGKETVSEKKEEMSPPPLKPWVSEDASDSKTSNSNI